MSAEITVTLGLRCQHDELDVYVPSMQLQIDQTTPAGGNPGTVTLGTSEEVLSFGDLAALGICLIKNLDADNFVTVGPESGGVMVAAVKIKPGEAYILRLVPGTTYRGKADTANVRCYICALDD